jgi:gluconolactonase
LEKIADGFTWVEGPVWHKQGGYLLFSDIPANSVYKWKSGEGTSVYLKSSGYSGTAPFAGKEPGSNGLTFDAQGRLVLCRHGDRQIGRLESNGTIVPLASHYDGRRINSPNDLVFKSNGDLYFTDPPFGLSQAFEDSSKAPSQGVYRLSKDGTVTLLIRDIKAPNGIAFSPDEKTLYLSDVDPNRAAWLAYDVQSDGTVANGRVFFDATRWRKHPFFGPDGFKVDRHGNRRYAPGHHRNRTTDLQCRMGRGWADPVHHGRLVDLSSSLDDIRRSVLGYCKTFCRRMTLVM